MKLAGTSGMVVAALALMSASATAETRDPAAAQALFDEAKELVRAGRYAEACPKLFESNRLDPGIGTQFHLASCYESSGRVATAWAMFLDVASIARATGHADRERAATDRAARLRPLLPMLEIDVFESSRVPGFELRRDGVLLGPAQWGMKVPVDPGEHTVTASAPLKKPSTKMVSAENGKLTRYRVPPLEDASVATPQAPPMSEVGGSALPSHAEPTTAASSSASNDRATVGAGRNMPLIAGLTGLGVVGVGVGTVLAVMARSTHDDSKHECRPSDPNLCTARGIELREQARSKGNMATVGFIAGGAGLFGAGLVWLLSSGTSDPSSSKPTGLRIHAGVLPGQAALDLQGTF